MQQFRCTDVFRHASAPAEPSCGPSSRWGKTVKAVIIGSGIGGLAAALALRCVGIEATVFERASTLSEVGAGISLWANAFAALDRIGVGDAVRERSLPVEQSEFRVRSGHRKAASFKAIFSKQYASTKPLIAMIHRADLVDAMAEALPEETIRFGFECSQLETRDAKPQACFTNGAVEEADVVIGADGLRSSVRNTLIGKQEPRYSGYTCWRGLCDRHPSVPRGYLGEWWGRGRRFGITTLPGDRVYWWATKNAVASSRSADEPAALLAAFAGWAQPVPDLIQSTAKAAVFRNDIFDRPPHPRWGKNRAVLVGDAAHPTTPNYGQGGCLAIEDAVVLARQLKSHLNVEDGIRSFAAERYPRTSAVTKESRRFGQIGQYQSPSACWLRDTLLGLLLPLVGPRALPRYAVFDPGPLAPRHVW